MNPATPADASPDAGRSRFVTLDGLRLHCVEWGPEDAPAVLCLHGLRSYARTFAPLAEALAGRFRLIALDQRGRGLSDWDPGRNYHAQRYAKDIADLVAALGLARFHLLGHSMGGINALVYARTHGHRLRSLILEDSGPGASRHSEGATRINAELAATPARFPDWDAARRFWRAIRPQVSEAAIDSRVANSLHEVDGQVTWRHDQDGITHCRLHPRHPAPDLWPCVRALACPTLLLRGAASDYLSRDTFAQMLAANPNITGVEIAAAGHYVHDDQPAAFVNAVQSFLARQPR